MIIFMLVIFFDGITKINIYVIFIKTSTVGGRGTADPIWERFYD